MIEGIRGVLLDVDGTLLDGDAAIPGAAECIGRLRRQGVSFRLTTNTTRRPRSAIAAALQKVGIQVEPREIVVPASLACRRIVESGRTATALFVPEASKEDLAQVREVRTNPDWLVVGDLGQGFTFDRLNEAFRHLRAGARFIALHKNPYWRPGPEGFVLDAGPFVAALEYASGVRAEVVGKPSSAFFEIALEELALPGRDTVSVGDSLENDCVGAAAAGCRTILVRTGVFSERVLEDAPSKPDHVVDSIADLFKE
ncbi:MAG TPA: TIGR01458 family HAD-type hydrolase [Candidatus Polarisedimenticolia bacterium]|nr:TIGR01458 family HAD-type hydrolase [Candidatus Polarisedimenticolia bacterium]